VRRFLLGFLGGLAVGYALATREGGDGDSEIQVDIAGVPDEVRRTILGNE
jgi:hypothetical protein